MLKMTTINLVARAICAAAFFQFVSVEVLGASEIPSLNGRLIYQQAYVKASSPDPMDSFGYAIAFFGNTLVVGAPMEDSLATGVGGDDTDNSLLESGAAYVYVREGGDWRFDAYLKPLATQASASFGRSVAIDGDVIVVGAPGYGGGGSTGDSSGAAFYFFRDHTGWGTKGMLTAFDRQPGDRFGAAVAVDGPTVAVGAPMADGFGGSASNAGAVYVFAKVGVSAGEVVLGENTEGGDLFGGTVAFAGGKLVVGSPGEDGGSAGVGGDPNDNSKLGSGAAYVFHKDGVWVQEAYLKASNPDPADAFGETLAATDGLIVVGTFHESSNANQVDGDQQNNLRRNSGAAYVFGNAAGGWAQEAYLKASNAGFFDEFASSVAVHGETVVVGARNASSLFTLRSSSPGGALSSGAGYVFQRSGRAWSEVALLRASNAEGSDTFGASAAIFGDTLVFGATGEDSRADLPIDGDQGNVFPAGRESGAVYVLTGLFDR